MKTFTPICLCLAAALNLASAGDKPGKPPHDGKGGHDGPPKPEEIMQRLDTDKDGFITLEEFKAGPRAKKHPEKAEDHFKHLDADGDGKISLEELKKAPPPPHPGGKDDGGNPPPPPGAAK